MTQVVWLTKEELETLIPQADGQFHKVYIADNLVYLNDELVGYWRYQ